MKQVFRTAAALLLAATVAAPALAQTLTGSITGTIKDEQGAVLPGVTVTLTGKQGTQDPGHRQQRRLPLPGARSRHLRVVGGPLGLQQGAAAPTSRSPRAASWPSTSR